MLLFLIYFFLNKDTLGKREIERAPSYNNIRPFPKKKINKIKITSTQIKGAKYWHISG